LTGCPPAARRCTAPTVRRSRCGPSGDRAALGPLPERPYVVCDRHIRRVGKDCLVSFEASYYSVP
jgi:hypothetical protein